jgi:hypothetical protein
MQLSENFFLAEFVRSDTALRRGIDNTPDIQQIMNLKFLCENILQPLRDKFGPIVISSGFRSFALNRAVGGSASSQHMLGEACDIRIPSIEVGKEYFEFLKVLPVFDQLIWERLSPKSSVYWIHVSIKRRGNNRKQVIPLLDKYK